MVKVYPSNVLEEVVKQQHISNKTLADSPDLNPLDYKLWFVVKAMVCSSRHANIRPEANL